MKIKKRTENQRNPSRVDKGSFTPKSLTDAYVNLSIHKALDIQSIKSK
jgi:hypothetical protein